MLEAHVSTLLDDLGRAIAHDGPVWQSVLVVLVFVLTVHLDSNTTFGKIQPNGLCLQKACEAGHAIGTKPPPPSVPIVGRRLRKRIQPMETCCEYKLETHIEPQSLLETEMAQIERECVHGGIQLDSQNHKNQKGGKVQCSLSVAKILSQSCGRMPSTFFRVCR